jgi:hypothetical protein
MNQDKVFGRGNQGSEDFPRKTFLIVVFGRVEHLSSSKRAVSVSTGFSKTTQT